MCSDPSCNGVPIGTTAFGPGDGQIIVGCCKIQDGFYCIWDIKHMGMVCEEWAEACDLRKVIHSVRHISFNVVQERQRARTALNNLAKEAPFDECKRFPWRKVYVNLSCGVYATLWENILSALDFKDREAEKEMKFKKAQLTDEDHHQRNEYSLDDAKTQFRNALKQFNNELCKRTEMFDRYTFEREYNLSWCVGKCPTDPGPGQGPEKPDRKGKYGDIMDKLRDLRLNPGEFSTFGPDDIVKGDFKCNRPTQEMGPGVENMKLPVDAQVVYVFTAGEYAKCNEDQEKVMGYIFDVTTRQLKGPQDLKGSSYSSENEFEEFVESLDLQTLIRNLFYAERTEKKYKNSKMPSSSVYAEALISSSRKGGKGKQREIEEIEESSGPSTSEENDYDNSR